MKLWSLLALALLVLSNVSFANDPTNDPVDENRGGPCETYEPGCDRPHQEEWEEPTRPNYPENPDDPYMPGDL